MKNFGGSGRVDNYDRIRNANEKASQEEAKQISLSEENEDETTPIGNLISKQEIVIDIIDKGKTKEQKVENKDQTTSMNGKWVETKMRNMIYGIIAPRVKHPTLE